MAGEEVTHPAYHILALGIERAVDWRAPPSALLDAIDAQEGVAIAAHPERAYWRSFDTASPGRAGWGRAAAPARLPATAGPRRSAREILQAGAGGPAIDRWPPSVPPTFTGWPPWASCRTYVFARGEKRAGDPGGHPGGPHHRLRRRRRAPRIRAPLTGASTRPGRHPGLARPPRPGAGERPVPFRGRKTLTAAAAPRNFYIVELTRTEAHAGQKSSAARERLETTDPGRHPGGHQRHAARRRRAGAAHHLHGGRAGTRAGRARRAARHHSARQEPEGQARPGHGDRGPRAGRSTSRRRRRRSTALPRQLADIHAREPERRVVLKGDGCSTTRRSATCSRSCRTPASAASRSRSRSAGDANPSRGGRS